VAATKYYLAERVTANPPVTGLPTTGQSAVLPLATTSTPSGSAQTYGRLDTTSALSTANAGAGQTATAASTNAQSTADADVGYLYRQLGAGTFGSGSWTVVAAGSESNGASNRFFAVSLYVWRVGSGVIGYIYDNTASLGLETSSGGLEHRVGTFTGANVTAQNGDYLICELWDIGTQSMATSYTRNGPYLYQDDPASADAVSGDAVTASNGYVQAPDALPDYDPGFTPIDPMGTSGFFGL